MTKILDRKTAAIQILALLGFFMAVKLLLAGQEIAFLTPGAVAILGSLVLIWFFQRKTGGFSALGLWRPDKWKKPVLTFLGTFASVAVIGIFLVPWLFTVLGEPALGLVPAASIPLIFVWARIMISAAFGEELVFRGFLLPRFEALFAGTSYAVPLAVFVQAVIFGLVHYSSGPATVVAASLIGLVFGAAYVLGGRNLWPLMLAHAIPDTISLLQS